MCIRDRLGTIGTEPRGFKEQFSNLYGWAYNQLAAPGNALGAGTNPGNDVGVFTGNTVQYANNFGPVWLGVAYSLGEAAGSFRKGNELSVGATYTGPVTVGLGYQQIADSGSGETPVSYTHLTLPTTCTPCRSRWSPYH